MFTKVMGSHICWNVHPLYGFSGCTPFLCGAR